MENDIQVLGEKIEAIRSKWGNRLCILGHFYQKPEILAHVDVVGDSFKLSKEAARRDGCDAIVFCGVHFMAETADMLANAPNRLAQREKPVEVLLPDLDAGCPMADMATLHGVEEAWNEMAEEIDVDEIAPITYVNSSAAIKAFCGKRGGFCCTSSNADKVLRRAFSEKKRVLFLPDEHLGENTAVKFGIPDEEILFWHHTNSTMLEMTSQLERFAFLPNQTAKKLAEKGKLPLGGNTPEDLRRAKIILWKGFCPVHQQFLPRHLAKFRENRGSSRMPARRGFRRRRGRVDQTDSRRRGGKRARFGLGDRHRTAFHRKRETRIQRPRDLRPFAGRASLSQHGEDHPCKTVPDAGRARRGESDGPRFSRRVDRRRSASGVGTDARVRVSPPAARKFAVEENRYRGILRSETFRPRGTSPGPGSLACCFTAAPEAGAARGRPTRKEIIDEFFGKETPL